MWIIFAVCSALFAGLTAILAKCGIRDTDSNVVTALRTVVVLIFSWIMVFITGSQAGVMEISGRTFLFLVLSGIATGASWLCYFKALQLGDVNKVAPIDKSSTVLTMLLAWIFLREEVTVLKVAAMFAIGIGTYLMIQKKQTVTASAATGTAGQENTASSVNVRSPQETATRPRKSFAGGWLWYALASAVFASLTSILGKVGIQGIDSNLGTAIRTVVVLVMAWIVVIVTGKQHTVKQVTKKSWLFIILSGIATGGSWLCYYRALQTGPASVVVPIDKLSILVTIAFSYIVFHEKLNRRSGLGLVMIVMGTLLLLL